MKKKLALIACMCALGGMTVAGTMAYFTDSSTVTNTFTMGDIDIQQSEPGWEEPDPRNPDDPEGDGHDLYPGAVKYKAPTVKNISKGPNKKEAEPAYVRMIVRIVDSKDRDITDAEMLRLIKYTIRYDSSWTGTPTTEGYCTGLQEKERNQFGYTAAEIGAFPNYNTDKFEVDTQRSTANKMVYNYKGKLNSNEWAVLFTDIAVPSDWNQTELRKIPDYHLIITTEAIQASGFPTQADAMNALDAEIASGTSKLDYVGRDNTAGLLQSDKEGEFTNEDSNAGLSGSNNLLLGTDEDKTDAPQSDALDAGEAEDILTGNNTATPAL